MKKRGSILIILIVAVVSIVALCVMRGGSQLEIKGRLIGSKSSKVYLESVYQGVSQLIDSMELSSDGDFRFVIESAPKELTLYELKCGWESVPMFAEAGDKITISSMGRVDLNYTIEGSDESELLRGFYQPYVRKSDKLRKIAARYATLQRKGENSEAVKQEYSKLYQSIKHEQLKYIIANKNHLSALYAYFQRLPGDSYFFNEMSDLIYMRTIEEALSESNPDSKYLKYLQHSISELESRMKLLEGVTSSDFPELNLPDMFGKKISLTALSGSVILVDFWSAELGSSNQNNAELREIYDDLHHRGFEVYQVGVDTSKAAWVEAVQKQRLKWISVSDLLGGKSPAVGVYNITSLPSNILIGKSGDIKGRNLYGDALKVAVSKAVNEPIKTK